MAIKALLCEGCGSTNAWVEFAIRGRWGSGAVKYERMELCRECKMLRVLGGEMFWKKGLNKLDNAVVEALSVSR